MGLNSSDSGLRPTQRRGVADGASGRAGRSAQLFRLCRSGCTSRVFFFLACQITARVRLGLKFLVLARGPGLDSLPAQELKPLSNKFFGLVGFDDITLGVFNDTSKRASNSA